MEEGEVKVNILRERDNLRLLSHNTERWCDYFYPGVDPTKLCFSSFPDFRC